MRRADAGALTAVALGALLALTACGSVTAKHTDGGGTGGTHADSSAKMDTAADRRDEDARHDAPARHDASSAKDMSLLDARATDARMTDARGSDASAQGGSGGGTGSGGAGGGGGECQSNGDCMLYDGAGSGCCGVCQPKSDPAPPPIECLLACVTPLVTCGCTNHQCVGSKKQL